MIEPKEKTKRGRGRALALSLAALIGSLALVVLAAYGLARSEPGRRWIAEAIEGALSTPGEMEVSIERLDGRLPQEVRLSGLRIRDASGEWLSAASVALDWAPLALLTRKLQVTSLRIADLTLERLPEDTGAPDTRTPGGPPSLPVDIAIERLLIADLTLGPAVLGQGASFRIEGQAAARDIGGIASSLTIARSDGAAGRASLSAVYRPGDDHLRVEAAIDEPAGGLIARALDLPDLPAVQARLEGDGALRDWRGRLSVGLDGLLDLRAQLKLGRGEAIRFDIAGAAQTQAAANALPWGLFAGDLTFSVAGQWSDDRTLRLDRAQMEGPAARLELAGNLALDTLEIDAEAKADLKDSSLVAVLAPGAQVEGLRLTARAEGPALQPRLSATLSAARVSAPGFDARTVGTHVSFQTTRPVNRGPIEGALSAGGTLGDLKFEGLDDLAAVFGQGVSWRLAGRLGPNGERFEADDLAIEAGPARLAASGTLGLADETIEAAVRLSLSDLALLDPLLGMDVQGGAEIDAWIEATGFGRQATAILAGELHEVRLDDPLLQALLGGTSTLAADLTFGADRRLALRDIALDTPTTRVSAEASLSEDFAQIGASYDVTMRDMAVLAKSLGVGLAGGARLRGRADGPLANPSLRGRLALTKARIEEIALDRLDADFTAEDIAARPRGHVNLAAATPIGEATGATDFVFAAPELRLTRLGARSLGARAEGTLTVPIDGRPLAGALEIETPDLAPWLALAGLNGGGAATADIRLSAEGAGQAAALVADVRRAVLRLDANRVVRGDSARVTVTASDITVAPAGRARIEAAGISLGELRLAKLVLEADGNRDATAWRIAADGAFRGPLTVEADGRLRPGPGELALEVSALRGRAFGQDVTLGAPVSLTQGPEAVTLGPLDLGFGGARIRAQGHVGATELSAKLAVEALPIASLDTVLPTAGLTGTLSAELSIGGARGNPTGQGRLRLSDLEIEQALQGPILALDLTTQWRDGRLALSGRLAGLPERDAELTAEVPLRLDSERLALDLPSGEPLSGHLVWQGEMASIWPLVPLDGHRLAGKADLSLSLAGTPAAPQVRGALRLADGEYENLDAGTLLKDLDLAVDFDDRGARLASLGASDGGSGRLSGSGEVRIDAQAGYPFALSAKMADFTAVRRDDVTAATDGEVSFTGSLNSASLTGRFETRLIEIRIVDRLPPEVVTLEVAETDAADKAGVPRTGAPEAQAAGDIRLDLAVDMPRRVFVRGRGLDSEWSGKLAVTGSLAEPKVEGEVELVRGQLSLLTKTFRLTRGSVRFPGGSEAIPELDIAAEHAAGEVTAIARISGPATRPSIALSSSPELPQDEIVSRVLFGKDRGQLSPLEAAQLAAAVAELSGAGGGAGVLDVARNLLGVDVLRVDTAGPGGTGAPSVEAGKYAAEGVYVGVKKGVTDQTGAVAVEIELTPNISVESEAGTTGERDIGIKFKWDY